MTKLKNSRFISRSAAAIMAAVMIGFPAFTPASDSGASVTVRAAAGDVAEGSIFSYRENADGTYSVCAIRPEQASSEIITIPESHRGKKVVGIRNDIENKVTSSKVFSLEISANIKEIEPYALDGLRINSVSVNENNGYFTESDNIIYTKDMETVIYCPSAAEGKVSIASGAKTIREDAFTSPDIEEIYIGHDIEEIPDDAFLRCTGIVRFSLNSKNTNFSIESGVLLDAGKTAVYAYPKARRAAFTFPDTVKEIKPYAFAGSLVPSLRLNGMKNIGMYAFENCNKLESVVIYNGTDVGEGAFSGCSSLSFAKLASGSEAAPAGLFKDCTALSSIIIPSSVTKIGIGAFDNTAWYNNQKDGFVYISNILYGYKTDYNSANGFGDPSKPEQLVIKDGTVAAAEGALRGANVVSISIPASMKYLDAESLYPAYNIKSFTVDTDNSCFAVKDKFLFNKSIDKLICAPAVYGSDTYTVPSTVTEIGSYAFMFNEDIKNIYISDNVKKFGICSLNNGDVSRAVVCMPDTPAASAAKAENVNRLFLESSVILSSTSLTLGVGESKKLTATVTPDVAHKAVEWQSLNPEVVSVSDGNITALKSGTAIITVTESGGKTASCHVTVKNAPESVSMSKTEMTVGVGETAYLNSSTNDGSASSVRKYTSSDTSVITISDKSWNCCFTARKAGTAIITVRTYNGKTAQCKITVKAAPTSVALSKTQISIGVGETVTISSTVNSGAAAYGRTYVSGNSNRVMITPTSWNCTFTGISAGTAVITVKTYNGKTAQCKVIVKAPPRFVNMEKGEVNIGVGESMTLGSVLLDSEGSASRTYRTSNSSIVKMTKTSWQAVFTGVKAGTAYVTVRTYNGQEASCRVNVKPAPTSVSLSKSVINMRVGDKAVLTSTVPSGTAATDRTYSTSDSSVIKMTRTKWQGEFTALKAGTCYVTVRTYNGKEASCKIIAA